MLSTLNMNPKIVLTRTPSVSAAAVAAAATATPVASAGASRRHQHLPSPYVLLEKMEKMQQPSCTLQRTMANLKGLDMIQVGIPKESKDRPGFALVRI